MKEYKLKIGAKKFSFLCTFMTPKKSLRFLNLKHACYGSMPCLILSTYPPQRTQAALKKQNCIYCLLFACMFKKDI